MDRKVMYLISVAAVLTVGFTAPASANVDYALIDFDRSGTQGTNETRIGDATARYLPWTIDTTSLTGDAYSITISATPGDNKFEFDDTAPSPAGDPFTATQKQGFVQRDGTAETVHIAFTGLAPGNYTLDAAAGADSESRWPIWSTTTGASVTNLTGTANGTAAIQAAWSFTVTSETGDQITINAASAGETNRGKVAAITLISTAPLVPTIRFDSDASGDLETISPALIDVILEGGEPDQTYTVDYSVVGGTATAGVDYVIGGGPVCWDYPTQCHGDSDNTGDVKGSDFLALKNSWYQCDPDANYNPCADFDRDGCVKGSDFLILKSNWYQTVEANCPPEGGPATLVFAPGETTKTISIDIIDDGLEEEDETILVELLNPSGPNVILGEPNQHVYTILDPRPRVYFVMDANNGPEGVSSANIAVSLSQALTEVVTVDYAVTGGTATGGGIDYTLADGTLQFDPGVITQDIAVTIVDDFIQEPSETIVLTLSNPSSNVLLGAATQHAYTIEDDESFGPVNVIVYHNPAHFAGWPANNGILWQWGDNEAVVGFNRYEFCCQEGHNNCGQNIKYLARTTDGGTTWSWFDPPNFDEGGPVKSIPTGGFDFTHPDFALYVADEFYWTSHDRCATWQGPYPLGNFGEPDADNKTLSSRTDYIVNGPKDCHVFVSVDHPNGGSKVFCIRTTDGGQSFQFQGWIVPQSDPYRAIMPSTVRISDTKLVSSLRRRNMSTGCDAWVDAYVSNDNGVTWSFLSKVNDCGCDNGNPPALVRLSDGRLCCAYENRSHAKMYASYSSDEGATWTHTVLRDDMVDCSGEKQDGGYPRITQLYNGRIICAYYWSTSERIENHIAATIWK